MPKASDPRFETIDSALSHCRVALAAIGEVLIEVKRAAESGDLDQTIALWLISAGARGQGLHSAIVRETLEDNPHAVFPLVRALLDLVMVTMQVRRDPQYVFVIVNDPATTTIGQRRKSPQALVSAGLTDMPDLRNAWSLLSEMGGHMGWAAFRTPLTVNHNAEGKISVTAKTGPGWTDPALKLTSLRHSTDLTRSLAGMIREITDAAHQPSPD